MIARTQSQPTSDMTFSDESRADVLIILLKSTHGARRVARRVLRGELPAQSEEFMAVIRRKQRGTFTFRIVEPAASTSPTLVRSRLLNANRHARGSAEAAPRYASNTESVAIEIIDITTYARRAGLSVGQVVRLDIREAGRGYKLHIEMHNRQCSFARL